MNGKFEEKLAMLAFGDLSPEEARELERRAASDPEAARALNEFRAMRAELKGLGDNLPPDQLSRERLRDAILNQGLRPQATKSNESRGWLWMPVLAGAAAFAFISFRPAASRTEEPRLVLGDGPVMTAKLTEPLDQPAPATILTKKAAEPKQEPAVVPVRRLVATSRVEKRSTNVPARPIVLNAADFAATSATGDKPKAVVAKERPTDPKATLVASKSSEEPILEANAGPIILIDTHKDADTGANSATEVGTPSNVLVGG